MAIKNWKKFKGENAWGKYGKYSKYTSKTWMQMVQVVSYGKNDWHFELYERRQHGPIKYKSFKSKSKALLYAKAYMRKH